jgi:hypothetical protein
VTLPTDPDRRARLLQAKLHALVRDHTGEEGGTLGGHAAAAHLRRESVGWFLVDAEPWRGLGPALAWARQQQVDELHVLVDDEAAGLVARRAQPFVRPPMVWAVVGRALEPAVPAPFPTPRVPPEGIESLLVLLSESGAEVAVEHGTVTGEWLGLEIARIVENQTGPRLEVGVGRHDREAFQLLHGDVPRPEALASVVDAARAQRAPESPGHPLTRLVQERWLRARLMEDPSLVGGSSLEPIEPITPRDSVKDVMPAAAIGCDQEDRPLLVVCSVGVDLDVVPEAADLRARHADVMDAPGARLVVVVPERDALPVTRDLAAALREPAEVHTVPDDWRSADASVR